MAMPYTAQSFSVHLGTLPPDFLYHYTSQAGLLGIIQSEHLHATKVQFMNDSTEFNAALSLTRELLQTLKPQNSLTSRHTAFMTLERSLNGLDDANIFAACFCEDGDLLSQWRGYTGASEGYAIGFNTTLLRKSVADTGFILGKCIYDKELQKTILAEAINHCVEDELAGRSNWAFKGPLADILFRCGPFFKDASFKEEKEWRLISQRIDFRHDALSFKSGRSYLVPHYKLSLRHDGTWPIDHVIVGPCPHPEIAKSSARSLLMQAGIYGPRYGQEIVFNSKIPFRNW